MGPAAAVAGFGVLLIFLAFAVQRQGPIYRGIVGIAAVIATLMITLSYVQLGSARQSPVAVAPAGPGVEKTATTSTVCVRQGIVPACNCGGSK